jgi:hypothetical protein
VRLVPEGLEGQKLVVVLDVAELPERTPVLVVVVLENEGFIRFALLRGAGYTSLRKETTFSRCFSRAFSLKSA